jgi:Mrp family chromosome partitioning ATPase
MSEESPAVAKFDAAITRHATERTAREHLTTTETAQAVPADVAHLSPFERLARVDRPSENLVPPALARLDGIHRITESFASLASISGDGRLAIAGCAAGDGCSSVAAAIALDLTQRIGIRTLLVDGNVCRPQIVKMFANRRPPVLEVQPTALVELESEPGLQIRSSNWARLEIASLNPSSELAEPADALEEVNNRVRAFPAAVLDLGAVRLDPRALPLVRPNDPVLLVVRSGCTRRSELQATMNIFSNIGRPVRGIILNATESAIPRWIRRLFRREA